MLREHRVGLDPEEPAIADYEFPSTDSEANNTDSEVVVSDSEVMGDTFFTEVTSARCPTGSSVKSGIMTFSTRALRVCTPVNGNLFRKLNFIKG